MLPAVHRAILGGTFDPPHLAHLVAGEAAYRQLGVDVVSFMPAGSPWQKEGRAVTAARHRLVMTRLATGGVPYFETDAREVTRDGPTYTFDTLATFPGDERITLVLGADAAAGIRSWYRADDVLARCRIAVAPRPGTDRGAVEEAVGERLDWLDVPGLEISGTALRRRVAEGFSIRFLVPESVYRYVMTYRLYREER